MAKHLNNAKMLSIIYMQKGNIYIRLGMSRQGKKNLDLASKYCEKIVDKSDRGIIFLIYTQQMLGFMREGKV